jgi:hypothetical protein
MRGGVDAGAGGVPIIFFISRLIHSIYIYICIYIYVYIAQQVLCVVGLTVGRAVSAVLQQHQQFLVSRLGLRVSGALKTAVYVKLLRLSAEQRQVFTYLYVCMYVCVCVCSMYSIHIC